MLVYNLFRICFCLFVCVLFCLFCLFLFVLFCFVFVCLFCFVLFVVVFSSNLYTFETRLKRSYPLQIDGCFNKA